MGEVHKVLTLEALHKTSLETQEIAACPLTPGIQGAENHLEMIGEVPQWTQETSLEIPEALPRNKDLVRPVAHGILVVTVAHQGLHLTVVFQDLFILRNSNGDLTKEDLLPWAPKVLILPQGVLVHQVEMSLHRIKKRRP